MPAAGCELAENRFGILLWNLLEFVMLLVLLLLLLFEGFERVFLSSGFQRLVNSGVELARE